MFKSIAQGISIGVDAAGIAIILLGLLWAIARFLRARGIAFETRYRQVRQDAGRAILLGLEFLVAADIIRTVAVEPTLANVATLGLIVLIRTFLSVALEVELEGRLPWQACGDRDRQPAR